MAEIDFKKLPLVKQSLKRYLETMTAAPHMKQVDEKTSTFFEGYIEAHRVILRMLNEGKFISLKGTKIRIVHGRK